MVHNLAGGRQKDTRRAWRQIPAGGHIPRPLDGGPNNTGQMGGAQDAMVPAVSGGGTAAGRQSSAVSRSPRLVSSRRRAMAASDWSSVIASTTVCIRPRSIRQKFIIQLNRAACRESNAEVVPFTNRPATAKTQYSTQSATICIGRIVRCSDILPPLSSVE